MKYLNLLSTTMEFQCLFPTARIIKFTSIDNNTSSLIIESDGELIEITHNIDSNLYLKLSKSKKIIDTISLYTNPAENMVIVCDRKLWYTLYEPLMKNFPEEFKKLEQLYFEKNVTVFFSFAILEAVNYEVEKEFLYDFKFNYIKIADYELFKNQKNCYYDSFYSLFHILSEGQLRFYLNPNLKNGWNEYLADFSDIFNNFNIVNRLKRNYIYNHTCQKPRYHRMKFLVEANKRNILKNGRNNVNIKFLEEYKTLLESGGSDTDNGKSFKENHKLYFTKELFDKFYKIKDKITITSDDSDFLYNHLRNYFEEKEYNQAYIEVVGETHCIFDLKYGFFTEKSIKPILSNNFLMVYGSQKVYDEFKRIGIEMFLDELGIDGIQNVDEIQQIEFIINAINGFNNNSILQLYLKNYDKIKNNRKKLIDYYCKIMNNVNKLLLSTYKITKTQLI